MVRFRHNSAASLDRALSKLKENESALVMTDGVFSVEGDIARLDDLVPIIKKHHSRLFVDDAHAFGVTGPGGRGTAHYFGLEDAVDMIGGTFSKSLASVGGYLVGEHRVLDYIRHFAPSFMFAASGAPSTIAAAMAAFDIMQGRDLADRETEGELRLYEGSTHAIGFRVERHGERHNPDLHS